MRVLNNGGRLALGVSGGVIDVARASDGRFGPEVQPVYARWDEFRAWAGGLGDVSTHVENLDPARLGPPVPLPPQVFAVGLNYREHAAEAGLELPAQPFVFTKFPASVTGPYAEVELPSDTVDFEAELVAVVGRRAHRVAESDAWDHIAGVTAGQDLSDRGQQLSGPAPQQYNLGKSFAGFAPIGPALVTPDELADADDLELSCSLADGQMQKTRTSDLIFPVAVCLAFLSDILPLLPGDLIFTGTPSGIGWTRDPRRTLRPGDELVTVLEGVGEMRHTFRRR
ncbi:MAG TPA: fumarylacetoacetate hydrolase family protein [Pseudonocardia sp.]|jgi:2-keto-4-pentenoate hydratase/2-oxohepta-3-ene-1,7-dioic acid hydratase in catechol pathway